MSLNKCLNFKAVDRGRWNHTEYREFCTYLKYKARSVAIIATSNK